jgi:hypothetical protein
MSGVLLNVPKLRIRFKNILIHFSFLIFLLLASSCASVPPVNTPEPIQIQYSFAAQPWAAKVSTCAGIDNVISFQRSVDFQDSQSADMLLRIGMPNKQLTNAFQIGTDDLLVIVNSKNAVGKLTTAQVRALFTGQFQVWKAVNGNPAPVQVWLFPAGEDVQQVFEGAVLGGSPAASAARLANSPEEMSQAILTDVNAIGIITGRLKRGNVTEVFRAPSNLPILAITQSKPQGTLAQILACLQK